MNDEKMERIRAIAYDLSDYIDDKLAVQIARHKYHDFNLEYDLDCIAAALTEIWKDNLENADQIISDWMKQTNDIKKRG